MRKKTHVIFTNDVGAPGTKISEDSAFFVKMQEIEEAENTDNAKYAHYYMETLDDYDQVTYVYVETTNA